MENTSKPEKRNEGKSTLAVIITVSFAVTILFWAAIRQFHLQGLPLYFTQLGLYLFFFLIALWGLKQEQIALHVAKRHIIEALAYSLAGWLVFLLVIQLFGLVQLPLEFETFFKAPAWKIGAQILSTWLFVGIGEEVLFRGYILNSFWKRFTFGTDRQRKVRAVLLSSVIFALWHLPVRIIEITTEGLDWITLLVSMLAAFMLGLGFAFLYVRSENIILTGLVHGLMDYPLVGKSTQLSLIILVVAILCVEIAGWRSRRRLKTEPLMI